MHYESIIIPIVVVVLAQILKLATDGIKHNLNLTEDFVKCKWLFIRCVLTMLLNILLLY